MKPINGAAALGSLCAMSFGVGVVVGLSIALVGATGPGAGERHKLSGDEVLVDRSAWNRAADRRRGYGGCLSVSDGERNRGGSEVTAAGGGRLPMITTVKVTRSHIRRGQRLDAMCCPIALAVRSARPNANSIGVEVGRKRICVDDRRYQLPPVAVDFADRFDAGVGVVPITFTLRRLP